MMKREKAERHLKNAREHFDWLRERYVWLMRDTQRQHYRTLNWIGDNPFTEELEDCVKEMKEVKRRICRLERMIR